LKWGLETKNDYYLSLNKIGDNSFCLMAAKGGNLELLKWLRKKFFYWDENICIKATKKVNLEALRAQY
jgi:hypothetical protein